MNSFFTKSEKAKQIIKGLELTRTLFVSSIIIGEEHTGKRSLVSYLFPDTPTVSGANQKDVEDALSMYDELIITEFEKLKNYETLDFDNKRIIAIASYIGNQNSIDRLFAFIYMMPPLREREEDTAYLKQLFLADAQKDLVLEDLQIDTASLPLDLSQNARSLRSSIYRYIIVQSMTKDDIKDAAYTYLYNHIDGNNAYRDHIDMYEKPLIQAGLDKYGSQLKLSDILGINRNTLRKKIYEHSID